MKIVRLAAPDPDHATVIEDHVFNYGKLRSGEFGWYRVHYTKAICGDCDATYDAATWWWDADADGDPMLVCDCGGQIYSKVED